MVDIHIEDGFYRIPEEVIDDLSLYKEELERFLKGELSPDRFKPFRVTRGIYAQRGQTTYMVRIKVPAGGLTPLQMTRIAELSERYGNGIPHVTTRQDMQIHWVKIEDTLRVMEGLLEVGLTPRGGGGNTVRNITACADSGVCTREVFDVSPYAIALTEYFLKHPKALTLPRKYKIAFSGCSDDCSLATVNDLGFIAAKKVIDGQEVRGFRVYVAGGMGAYSRVADLLEDFISAEDVLLVAEAVMNLFDKHGNRRNKHKARLRFVMDRFGFDEFKRIYKEEVEALRLAGKDKLSLRETRLRECVGCVDLHKWIKDVDIPGFDEWFRSNVVPQKQDGFFYAKIRLPFGDITADRLKGLADIVRDFGEGSIRTSHDQNIVIRWLNKDELPLVYSRLNSVGLATSGAGGISDVVSCPGAATCNLGICLSKNMASALSKELEDSGLPLERLKGVDIKISGCPNSCGQHPIGAIGLHGAARRGNGRMAPHYEVLIGGRIEEGRTRLGTPLGFVPAKNIPYLVKEILSLYVTEGRDGEDFYEFLDKAGKGRIEDLIHTYSHLPRYKENRDFYIDWGAKEEFSLAGLGPGECGAGVFDMIETDINDARINLQRAIEAFERGNDPSEYLYKGLVLASKALLITQGIEPVNDLEAFRAFEDRFIDKGLVPEIFRGLQKKGAQFLSGLLDSDGIKEGLRFLEDMIGTIQRLYDSMDDSLRFKGVESSEKGGVVEEDKTKKAGAEVFMDLRGVKCPINYVKAKIRLEDMVKGETLLLYLDEGEPIRNVPSSLKNDGQEIIRLEKVDSHYELLVKKLV